jgi:hypothetical protein
MHDASFSVKPEQAGTAFLPYTGTELEKIFSQQQDRVVGNDNTVRYDNRCLQIPQQTFRFSLARCRVLVCEHLDHTITVHYGNHVLGRYDAAGQPIIAPAERKQVRTIKRAALMKDAAKREGQTREKKNNQKATKRAA